MTVWSAEPEFAKSPRLVCWRIQRGYTSLDQLSVKLVNPVDGEVGHVSVVAYVPCRLFVWTLAEHNLEGIAGQKTPAIGAVSKVPLEPKGVREERGGRAQIADSENSA